MKFLSKRNQFLAEEAKIKDVILPRQAKQVEGQWGSEYLEYEEIEPTDRIQQGVWKLDDDDKMQIFSAFFNANVERMYENFANLSDHFAIALNESVDLDLLKSQLTAIQPEKAVVILEDFNIQFPSIDAICILSKPIFRKISVGETKATEVITRDERGMPLKDENNKIIKRNKEEGEVIYSKNLVNINTFVDDYNDCFGELKSVKLGATGRVDQSIFSSGDVSNVINLAAEDFSQGSYEVDYNPFSKDMYLVIKHNPKDILNMSVSKYYSSCQHLYSGMYRQKVIGNVFDPNTIPAFIVFDSPIVWKGEKISDQLPLCRMMIRNLETFDTKDSQIYFDRCYPDRCKDDMDKIIEKHTQMQSVDRSNAGTYYFTPDLPENVAGNIDTPYMDRLGIGRKRYIGINTKSITLTPNIDWSDVKVSPKAKLKEIIIQSSKLPDGLLNIPMEPDWIKFKFLRLKDLSVFKNLKSNSYAFDKCEFSGDVLSSLPEDVKKIQLISCDTSRLDLSKMVNIEELHLVYTLNDEDLIPSIRGLKMKKLVISGDLLSLSENKSYINSLKKQGVKIEIIGPVL
jgi:hypothetical protein